MLDGNSYIQAQTSWNLMALIRRLNSMPLMLTAILAVAVCGYAPAAPPQPMDPERPGKSLAYWLKQLDSDRFVEREDATRKLAGFGVEAVDPLAESIRKGNRETISRGAYVLYKLAMNDQGEAGIAAYQALRKLLESEKRAVAGIARKHVDQVHITRQKQALAKLLELGAELKDEFIVINPIGQAEPARTLEIGDEWKGEETDLSSLQWLYDIRYLAFRTDKAEGSWLQYAARMDALESLAVRGGKMGDAHFQLFMQNQKKLRIMELKYVPISDASIDSMAKHLSNVASLKLYGTKVTTTGVERIRKGLPKADVDYRQGGFLGVGCQTHPLGCHVSRVQAKSAAEKAGLAPGDVIIEYANEKVTNFEELTQLISKNEVGDKVRVVVARNVQSAAIAVAYDKDGLKIKTKRVPLGLQLESLEDSSTLQNPDLGNSPFPASVSTIRAEDVIIRINGEPIPNDKSADEIFHQAHKQNWQAAYDRIKQQLEKADDPENGDAEAIDAKARKMADEEAEEERIQIQFARGGKVLVKNLVLGAWD